MSDKQRWVALWLAKAGEDLGLGEWGMQSDRQFSGPICFHAQQAAEKALKGFLLFHDREFRKTHDLETLCRECAQVDPAFAQWRDACEILSGYAVEPRYPDDFEEYTRDLAAEALDLARQIRDFVLAKIPRPRPEV